MCVCVCVAVDTSNDSTLTLVSLELGTENDVQIVIQFEVYSFLGLWSKIRPGYKYLNFYV